MMRNITYYLTVFVLCCGGGEGLSPGDTPLDMPPELPDVAIETSPDLIDEWMETIDEPDGLAEEVTVCDASELIAKGKEWLEKAEPGFALNEFMKALASCPNDIEARFGAAISEMIYGAEQFVSVLTVLSGQGTGPKLPAKPIMEAAGSQNEWLAKELHVIFMALREHFINAADHLAFIGDAEPNFKLDAVPVYLGIKPSLILRGKYDNGDVLLMRAIANLFAGIFDVLAGQNLNTDLLSLVEMGKDALSKDVDFIWISRFLAYLLNDNDAFLTPDEDVGNALFSDSKERFASVGPLLHSAISKMREYGQGPDEVSFIAEMGNDVTITVRNRVKKDEQGQTTEEPWTITLSNQHLQAFLDCSRSILSPGYKITLHASVIPVLSTIVVGLVRTGILDAVGLNLPLDISALDVDDLAGLIRSLMPNVLAFDWGEFFSNPVGLREFMPVYTDDRPLWKNELIVEWECPDDLLADGYPKGKFRLFCSKGASLIDAGHFIGLPYETEPDGVTSESPVIAFEDPTFNGLIYVNLEGKYGSADTTNYELANHTTLNSALAMLLDAIIALFNK